MDTIRLPEKHDHSSLIFPHGFLWGAATSAHQVEGNNIYSDWWDWEEKHQPKEKRSGLADDQYNKYSEDFQLARDLNHNAHRLSIEWARIEPKEGEFDHHEIEHYTKVLKDLKDKNFTVMLTLWHFTLPKWVAEKGGWENRQTVFYFERFVKRIFPEIKDYVDLWVTINEPLVYAASSYLVGTWPPQKRSKIATFRVLLNLASAHKKVYKYIHKSLPNAQVGIAHNVASFASQYSHSIIQHISVWVADLVNNHLFYILTGIKTHDFLGLNYYFHERLGANKEGKLPKIIDVSISKRDVSDLGWELYPEGIYDVLIDLYDYKKPIYITENGLASTNDDRRCRFLIAYLKEIYHAIDSGVDVKGYFHWSLIDNFEWHQGFTPRFGLIEIDYQTQKRIPRLSAYIYAHIISNNGIEHYMLRFLGHTVNAEEVLNYKQHFIHTDIQLPNQA